MRHRLRVSLIVAASLALGSIALDEGKHGLDLSALPDVSTAAPRDGQAARDSFHTVLNHPRDLNCHVGADNVPLWG